MNGEKNINLNKGFYKTVGKTVMESWKIMKKEKRNERLIKHKSKKSKIRPDSEEKNI